MRRLASATEFSPGIVKLERILELVTSHLPDRPSLVEAIRVDYFTGSALQYEPERRLAEQTKRANNVLIGLREYGLVEGTCPSELALRLAKLPAEDQHAQLARHILLHLGGVDLLRAVLDLTTRRERINKDSLAEELRNSFDYEMPRDTTKHLLMLGWLRLAGVLPQSGYKIDESRVEELAGVQLRPLDEWQSMPLPQQAFLQVLRRLAQAFGDSPQPVKTLLNQAELEYGRLYRGGRTAAAVIAPLEAQGWVTAGGSTGGRGSKSGVVAPTPKLMGFDAELAMGFSTPAVPAELREMLARPMGEIYAGLKSSDTYVAGLSLELLALHMCLDLGLSPVEFRKRDNKTGGGEVDLLAEAVQLHFSRWLFQCKNQKSVVTLGTLAKEIGMAVLLHAQVIVIATTGRFAKSVLAHAEQIALVSPMQVILIDGDVIRRYAKSGEEVLKRHFRDQAAGNLRIKTAQRYAVSED